MNFGIKQQIIIAFVTAIISVIIAILLPAEIRIVIFNLVKHQIELYLFTIPFLVIFIILISIAIIFLRKKFFFISLLTVIIIATVASYFYHQQKWSQTDYFNRKSLSIGFGDFLTLSKNGTFLRSTKGNLIAQLIYSTFGEDYLADKDILSKVTIITPFRIKMTDWELSRSNLITISGNMRKGRFKNQFDIGIWGVVSNDGSIQQIKLIVNDNMNIGPTLLNQSFSEMCNKYEELMIDAVRGKPLEIAGPILSKLFYAYFITTTADPAAIATQNPFVGTKLIDEAASYVNHCLDTNNNRRLVEISKFQNCTYSVRKATIFERAKNSSEFTKALYEALCIDPYYPFESYEEFKNKYASYSASNFFNWYIKDMKNADNFNEKSRLFSYNDHNFLFELFSKVIAENDGFEQNIRYFAQLESKYPNNALVYLFGAEAYKLSKDSSGHSKLATTNMAIEKYKRAEMLDPQWQLIGMKIAAAYKIKMDKMADSGYSLKEIDKTFQISQPYIFKLVKYFTTPEMQRYFR